MATAIATANGNFTAAGTWATVDATSLLDSEAASTTLTTAYVESSTFTPGAITIDGIAVKVAGRATAAVGTMSIRLAQAGVTVAGTEIAINVSDVPRGTALVADSSNGWIFVKFAAPVLLVAATLYTVSAKTSTANMVSLYRNATAGNWSRMLRTTTTAALVAGDNWFILGEWTAAATKTNRTVTMDQTATTDYGGASTTVASFGIGVGGTLTWATVAATNYILRLSGILIIHTSGTMSVGTDPSAGGTAIPRDSSAEIQWDSAADGDFGYVRWGALNMFGLSRTVGKDVVQCLLNTDEAIAQTVLGVDTDTGWLNGDEVAIASTTRTETEAETATLNGAAGATSITVSAGISAAHSGTAPNQAEVILITRNVRMTAVTTTAVWYGYHRSGGTVALSWALFRHGGVLAGGTKIAQFFIDGTGPTSFSATFCAFANGESHGIQQNAATAGIGVTYALTDCVFYAVGQSNGGRGIEVTSGGGTWNLTRCTSVGDSSTAGSMFLNFTSGLIEGFTITNCRITSAAGIGINISASSGMVGYTITTLITGCVLHALGGGSGVGAMALNNVVGLRIVNTQIRRCSVTGAGTGGLNITSGVADLWLDTCTFVACNIAGIGISRGVHGLRMTDCVLAGDATFGQAAGISLQSTVSHYGPWRLDNCTFGVGTAHTTADFTVTSLGQSTLDWTLNNCVLASATEFAAAFLAAATTLGRSVIRRHRKDGVTNVHEAFYPNFGTVAYDTATVRSAGASEKLSPTVGSSAIVKLRSNVATYPVASGKKITFSAYVQKDASYNGNAPRLVLLANPALGIDTDVVLDTLSVGSGSWELLTGQMTLVAEEAGAVQAVVECDGTAGAAYVDDWSAATT